MKLSLFMIFTLLMSSAYAGDEGADTEIQMMDMELTKDIAKNPEPNTVVLVREDVVTIPESSPLEVQKAIVIDEEPRDIEKELQEVKVEIGSDHDAINYPKFLASVFTLNFSNSLISLEKIVDGGVVVDEIPTLVNPLLITIKEADDYLHYTPNEYMAVVEINGDARAYPLRVLNWHQGVNDEVGGQPVFVVYDPLSGNVTAMDRRVNGEKETTFGVTGQIYNSASLYYDRATKSVWAPFENRAVTGPLHGQRMKRYPAVLTTWQSFKETYPDGAVLDMMNTGYDRNYRQNPYGDYAKNTQMLFPVTYASEAFPRKEYMLGARLFKGSRRVDVAIPMNVVLSSKQSEIKLAFDEVQVLGSKSIPVTLKIQKPYGMVEVVSEDKDVVVEQFYGYWFVWSAHNPNSRIVTSLP